MLFSLLTLLSGIVIGAGVTLIIVGPPQQEPAPPGPEYFSRRFVGHMTRELGLTVEQQQAIRNAVETHMKIIDQYREEARPKIRQEIDTMNEEILALMDENQQQQWKENIDRMQQWWLEARERRGPGGAGDGPRRRDQDPRDGEWRGRDRDDRNPDDRGRFRRGDGPGRDPNSPFFRRPRPGGEMPDFLVPPPTQNQELTPEG